MSKSVIVVPRNKVLVSARVQAYLNVSRAANTIAGYVGDVRSFLKWGGRIPARPELVAEFLADEAATKAYATLRRKSSAISLAHRELGYASPCQTELVKGTLRGIRRTKPGNIRRMQPLLASQVIAATHTLTGVAGCRDRALLLVGFAGAFRRAELIGLNVEDLTLRESNLVITLRSSKTDQLKRGREVVIPSGRGKRCPVNALREWFRVARIEEGAVFRGVDRFGNVLANRLNVEAVAYIVKRRVSDIGLDAKKYGGHSLRAGFVTTAASRGIASWVIKKQTGHSSDSSLEIYIRQSVDFVLPKLL